MHSNDVIKRVVESECEYFQESEINFFFFVVCEVKMQIEEFERCLNAGGELDINFYSAFWKLGGRFKLRERIYRQKIYNFNEN